MAVVRIVCLLLFIGAASAKLESAAEFLRLLSSPEHDYEAWLPREPPRRHQLDQDTAADGSAVPWSGGTSAERMDYYGASDDVDDEDKYMEDMNDDVGPAEPPEKRSAVMAALTAAGGRRRRRVPAPQHQSKAAVPFVEVGGVLDSLGDFMGSLRQSLKTIQGQGGAGHRHAASAPNVILGGGGSGDGGQGGGGGGSSRRLYALRPLYPNMHIRSYDRRSFVGAGAGAGEYRGANQHDPGLLWTGLGRRRRR